MGTLKRASSQKSANQKRKKGGQKEAEKGATITETAKPKNVEGKNKTREEIKKGNNIEEGITERKLRKVNWIKCKT